MKTSNISSDSAGVTDLSVRSKTKKIHAGSFSPWACFLVPFNWNWQEFRKVFQHLTARRLPEPNVALSAKRKAQATLLPGFTNSEDNRQNVFVKWASPRCFLVSFCSHSFQLSTLGLVCHVYFCWSVQTWPLFDLKAKKVKSKQAIYPLFSSNWTTLVKNPKSGSFRVCSCLRLNTNILYTQCICFYAIMTCLCLCVCVCVQGISSIMLAQPTPHGSHSIAPRAL